MKSLEQFASLRERGVSPEAAVRAASALGLGEIEMTRILRAVYELSFKDAKTILLRQSGVADSVEQHEAAVAVPRRGSIRGKIYPSRIG